VAVVDESQCSTLVRNTVVRATITVSGKPPISGSRSPLTPLPIDLIFDTGDYVGDMTSGVKNGKNRSCRAGPAKELIVKIKDGYFYLYFNFLSDFLPASGDHFLQGSTPFSRPMTCFGED